MTAHVGILSPTELKEHLNEGMLRTIIDARPYSDYVAGHIPGAVWMGWEAWCEKAPAHAGQTLAQPGYWGVLKEVRAGTLRFPFSGQQDGRPVLVYADGPSSKGREARIAWMLLYWGISPLLLLNGGWSAWLKCGGSSDVSIPPPKYGQFRSRIQAHRRIQLERLKQDLHSNTPPILVDARSRAEFDGYEHAYQPRLGRLPGAVHVPYTDLFDEAGNFVAKSVYLQRLPAEVKHAGRCVAYCEVGVRSCLFALLHEVYTGQVVANFDGSIMEWGLDSTLPMERQAFH